MPRKCTTCGEVITLSPSAADRAKKYGGNPSDYEATFTQHTWCTTLEIAPHQLPGNYMPGKALDWFKRSATFYDPATHPHGLYNGVD